MFIKFWLLNSKNFSSNGTSTNKKLEFAAEFGLWSETSQHIQEPKQRASSGS